MSEQELPWLGKLYRWAANRLYNEFAWAYDLVSWLVSLGHWSRWRRAALDHVMGERVLEIGFGTGDLLIEMIERNWHVFGLELSPAMHRVTARRMRRHGARAPRVLGRAQAMPFVDGSFDTVIATFPTGYVLSPKTLREVSRILRGPGLATGTAVGRFVVVGLFSETDSAILGRVAQLVYGRSEEHLVARTERLAAEAGFKLTVVNEKAGRFRWPILILEKTRMPASRVHISARPNAKET